MNSNFAPFFTVPSGCVPVEKWITQEGVWAAPDRTSQEECESKPDRCYWSEGWDVSSRRMKAAVCYYSTGRETSPTQSHLK